MKKRFDFVPVDYDYFDFQGRNYVKMIGRDEKGRRVCVIDSYDANFYLILNEKADESEILEKIRDVEVKKGCRVSTILKTEVLGKKFLGKSVRAIRVWITNHKDGHDMASAIGDLKGIEFRREYDIPLVTKYIKEKGVEPLKWHRIKIAEPVADDRSPVADLGKLDVEECFFAEKIRPIKDKKEFVPKILAYDIETSGREIGKDEILMISVYDGKKKRVITWKSPLDSPPLDNKHRTGQVEWQNYVEVVQSEAAMLERFCEVVRKSDADVLVGYFSDGFDLPYLKARADKFKVVLDLGVSGKGPVFARGRVPSGKIPGRVHVDLFRFIEAVFSQYLQSETLSLDEVANELIGARKEEFDFSKLTDMRSEDWRAFFSYNMQDAVVTYKLAEKVWPDIAGFCGIEREPVYNVTRNSMASHVENHILHNLDRFDEIAERRPGYHEINERKARQKFEGAFVFEPTPGFYEDIVMFDFTSMHSSLIVTFNICGQSLLDNKHPTGQAMKNYYESPEFKLEGKEGRVYFDKKPGFFSTLLSEVVDKRKAAKAEYKKEKSVMKKARSNAYKLLANATFGYQGFSGARYYSYEAAAATLAYVRKLIHDTMDDITKRGFKIIYGDTDSIAFLRDEKSKDDIRKILKEINAGFPGIIELDLEGFFDGGLFVAKRGGKVGAKKKYALIGEDGRVKIRGFETVRRDWCGLARGLQDKVLRKVLKDGNERGALKLVRDVVTKLKRREVGVDELVIKTQLKRDVEDYVAKGPHVAAAKKMIDKGLHVGVGSYVEYFIGEGVGKKVGERVCLKGEDAAYDVEHYLKKQVLPAVEGIFDVFGVDVGAVLEGERQETLF